ncbi:MAG: AAA family ATPase, partial [Sphaerochaeta sp.]
MTETSARVKPLSFEEASFDFDLTTIQACRAKGNKQRIVGQPRALRTLELALSLHKSGFNLYVSGDSGSGRHEAVRHCVQDLRADISTLRDIVYVCNFPQPDSPKVLILPQGEGERFSDASELFNQEILNLAIAKEQFLEKALALVDGLEADFSQSAGHEHFTHLRADLKRMAKHIRYLDEQALRSDSIATKYRANLIVNHARTTQKPLIIENHPSFTNLFGSVDSREKVPHLSLHAGSLLEASGGYIVIDAEELLSQNGLWDALKRHLDANTLVLESKIPSKGELKGSFIRPQVPALPLKVILIGSEETYDTLTEGDERFLTLFKLNAQFDYSMSLDETSIEQSIATLESYAQEQGLLPLDDSAFCQLLRYSCWFVESRTQLSTQFSILYDLLEEA